MDEPKEKTANNQPWSFEVFLRRLFKGIIDPVAGFLLQIGITPNMVTAFGLVLSTIAAFFITQGKITVAGLILLVGGPLDVIDGSMARKIGEPGKYGAFIDSVTDRYSELVIFGGLLIHFIRISDPGACLLVFLATAGSVLVSYVKARAEALGMNAKVGILTRVERLIVMIACLVFNIPVFGLWIIAILANITAFQRIIFVRKQILQK